MRWSNYSLDWTRSGEHAHPAAGQLAALLGKQTGMESYDDPKAGGVAAPKLDLDESLALTRRCKYAIHNL